MIQENGYAVPASPSEQAPAMRTLTTSSSSPLSAASPSTQQPEHGSSLSSSLPSAIPRPSQASPTASRSIVPISSSIITSNTNPTIRSSDSSSLSDAAPDSLNDDEEDTARKVQAFQRAHGDNFRVKLYPRKLGEPTRYACFISNSISDEDAVEYGWRARLQCSCGRWWFAKCANMGSLRECESCALDVRPYLMMRAAEEGVVDQPHGFLVGCRGAHLE